MMDPEQSWGQLKELIRDRADIVQIVGECVELKRSGQRFSGLCPFHGEKTPSFTVHPQRQHFHCFGCGESGDVFSFVMKHYRLDFPASIRFLAKKYAIDLPEKPLSEAERSRLRLRGRLYEANEAALELFQTCLEHAHLGKLGREYLKRRGVSESFARQYGLGCAPAPETAGWDYLARQLQGKGFEAEILQQVGLIAPRERGGYYDRFRHRIMFPLYDMSGRVAAFGGRALGESKPKYMNSPESPIFEKSRLLFGLYQHRQAIRQAKSALVVEGNFDLLLLAAHGIGHVVAPLGTALTRAHIHALRSYSDEVVLLFDADTAGLQAALRSIPLFLAEHVEGKVALLPAGHDPDSFVREKGAEAIATLVEQARPLAEFAFDALVRRHGLTLSGKMQIVTELNTLLASATDARQRALMTAHFSEKLGVSASYFQDSGQKKHNEPAPSPEIPLPAAAEEKKDDGASGLEKLLPHEKQVVDFILLYPEFFPSLKESAMELAQNNPVVKGVFALLDRAYAAHGGVACQPEDLLELANGKEGNYIASLLTRETPFGSMIDEEEDDAAQRMCEELLAWLRAQGKRQASAQLQQRIQEAERLGSQELLHDLMRKKLMLDREQ